jgi:hypothetical protein
VGDARLGQPRREVAAHLGDDLGLSPQRRPGVAADHVAGALKGGVPLVVPVPLLVRQVVAAVGLDDVARLGPRKSIP